MRFSQQESVATQPDDLRSTFTSKALKLICRELPNYRCVTLNCCAHVTENRLANGCSFQIAQIPIEKSLLHVHYEQFNKFSHRDTEPFYQTYIRSAHQLCFLGVSCFRFPSSTADFAALPPVASGLPGSALLPSHATLHLLQCS